MPSFAQARTQESPRQSSQNAQGAGASSLGSNSERASQLIQGSLQDYVASGGRISLGMKGPAVVELQKMLGFGSGGQTGEYGTTTQKAVIAFQAQNQIQQTGEVGKTTYDAMKASGNLNNVLFQHQTQGASEETVRGQGVAGHGVEASQNMAREDRDRLLKYKQNFITVAQKYKLPPALLAAIASRETRGGQQLDSQGYSIWDGAGFGLMQVDRNYYTPKGGPGDIDHITQAATILADFLATAKAEHPSLPYSKQLQMAVADYNGGNRIFDHPSNFDAYTTGDDYSSDTWARARELAKDFGGTGLPDPAQDTSKPDQNQESQENQPDSETETSPENSRLTQEIEQGRIFGTCDQGDEVLAIQKALGMRGGGLTGKVGPTTEGYIRRFQRQNGLKEDGLVGPDTYGALMNTRPPIARETTEQTNTSGPSKETSKEKSPQSGGGLAAAIKAGTIFGVGDEGPEVLEIQTLLGFSASGKTSKYGPTTEAAVKAFQAQNNIQANGRVGPDTYAALTRPKSSTPLIDQHRMDHERAGAFCGIATLLMTLQGNGKDVNPQSRNELDQFSQGIYIPGNGSSGAGMANRMREHGLKDAQFTTGGTVSSLVSVLAKGKPVPMGVVSISGKVVEMKKPSARYPDLKVGDSHYHRFGASGHWVTVVGFEGDPKRPSYFYVNDPDTGAKLKMTKAELEESAAAGEGIWMIKY